MYEQQQMLRTLIKFVYFSYKMDTIFFKAMNAGGGDEHAQIHILDGPFYLCSQTHGISANVRF